MPSICMLLTNPAVNDSRVLREARALAGAGYDVRIVATRAEGAPESEDRDGFRITRVPSEPRLVGVLRRLALRARALRGSAARDPGASAPCREADGGETGGESVFDQGAWVAATGGRSDRDLLRRDRRAMALRLGLKLHMSLAWWRFARAAFAAVREQPAEVYVAHDLDTLPLAALLGRWLGGRVVYDSHELYLDHSVNPPPGRLWRARWSLTERLLIGRADLVITVCDSIAELLAARYGVERPTVVRNIPELPDTRLGDEEGLRGRLGIPEDARIALYLGGVKSNRALERYVDAVRLLPEVVLVLLGPGDPAYVGHLRAHAERLGVSDRVRIPGPVPPEMVGATARDADLTLIVLRRTSLSVWYCLPSKLFESIQAGVPVVTNDWPELRRVVERYDVGALCESDEPTAIARAVAGLLEDRERYERMRENARRASRELTWERESKRLLGAVRT